MATETDLHAGTAKPGEHAPTSIISPDASITILTYVTFFLLLATLYKFAWKPILAVLDEREEGIRKSLEDAQEAREELARVSETGRQLVAEADEKAKQVIDRARKAAHEAAHVIEHKAKEEAQILLGNATHELDAMKEKARMALRGESVDAAVVLANKIIRRDMDKKAHQKLIDELIEEFHPDE